MRYQGVLQESEVVMEKVDSIIDLRGKVLTLRRPRIALTPRLKSLSVFSWPRKASHRKKQA